ncbi:MFS transporter [Thalassotalea fonticola]|uniref:MFS transporter n=1 Tax=Thalassotalea fonticola TaxID=3065649 RepID=A0ABZ0GKI2_9GAMM|nr:MFS transporter [Colwelliaceae bacterium S1-1]
MQISNKYIVEAIVFFSYVLFAMAWVGGTASMNQIMAAMQIDSLASASFISGSVTLAKIVGTFTAAWLAIKMGIKKAFFIACALITFGLFTPFATNYEVLLLSRFLMGLGGAFMIVYFNPIVMHWFDAEQRPTVNGINAVAFNVGTAIILWSMSDFNELTGNWQTSLLIFSLASLVLAVAWLLVKFDTTDSQATNGKNREKESEESTSYSYLDGFKDKFNWAYAFTYSGLLAFYICLFTFYPKAGISESKWVIGFGIIGTIAGILYSKKFPKRIPVIRFSGLMMVITIIGLSFSANALVQSISAIVLGFFIFFPVTALVTIPHELPRMNQQKITVIFSLFWSSSYLVATIVLWVFGKLVDANNGDYTGSLIMITALSSTFFFGSFFLPEPKEIKE